MRRRSRHTAGVLGSRDVRRDAAASRLPGDDAVGAAQGSRGRARRIARSIQPRSGRHGRPVHQIKTAHEPPPLHHPSMADLYRTQVEQLAAALQADGSRLEASETLRGLIDSIVLTPHEGQLRIELRGNLAAMLTVAQPPSRAHQNTLRASASLAEAFGVGGQTKRSPDSGDLIMPVQMVAGGGFEPPTFGL